MDRDAILKVLLEFGLNERKLALSDPSDAEVIAEQVCAHHGCICESLHVQYAPELIQSCRIREPIRKRLRGDHHLDPLELREEVQRVKKTSDVSRPFVSASSASSSKRVPRPLGVKHRPVVEQSEARERREQANIELCVGQDSIHLAIAGKTRTSTLKRYVKCWQDWQHRKRGMWGETKLNHPSMFCEYLFSRFDEPCGPTVPGLICKAVHWFEKFAFLRSVQLSLLNPLGCTKEGTGLGPC